MYTDFYQFPLLQQGVILVFMRHVVTVKKWLKLAYTFYRSYRKKL